MLVNYFYCNNDTTTPCDPQDDSNCPGECTLLDSDICDCLGNIYDCADVCGGDSFIDGCTVCRPGDYNGDTETDGGNILGHDSNGFPLCDPNQRDQQWDYRQYLARLHINQDRVLLLFSLVSCRFSTF